MTTIPDSEVSQEQSWYSRLGTTDKLTQGELLFGCPVVTVKAEMWAGGLEITEGMIISQRVNAIVMSQDCDLANDHVEYVIVCPVYRLLTGDRPYKTAWEETMTTSKQNPTVKAWGRHYEDIRKGYEWPLSMLNDLPKPQTVGEPQKDKLIVDFKEVFSLPVDFLQSWVEHQQVRLFLTPPYREHLAQAFARFFMRVGLPTAIPAL